MRGFVNIRTKLGNYFLQKRLKKFPRDRKLYNFHTAVSAGILFDANEKDSFGHIKEFGKFLKTHGMETHLLGYVESKELPDEMVLWDNCDLISLNDVDWMLRPKSDTGLNFIDHKYNILFDLSLKHYFTICYISRASAANFKVGRYTEEEDNDFDLMIDLTKNPKVDYFIEQIKYYISILNNPEKQA